MNDGIFKWAEYIFSIPKNLPRKRKEYIKIGYNRGIIIIEKKLIGYLIKNFPFKIDLNFKNNKFFFRKNSVVNYLDKLNEVKNAKST